MMIPCIWYYFKLNLVSIRNDSLEIAYTVTFCMLGMYILTSLKPLRILGQPDRYFEYSIICQGYIIYYLCINNIIENNFLIAILSINVLIIGINLAILFRPNKVSKQYNADSLHLVAEFLDKHKRRVLVIPSKLGYELACITNNCKYWLPMIMEKNWWKHDKIGFKYMRNASNLTYYDQHSDFTHTMNQYNLDTVVISKNDIVNYNMTKFIKISEYSDYSIFEYKS